MVEAQYHLKVSSPCMWKAQRNHCDNHTSWRHAFTVRLAPSVFIVPPIWFGLAGYSLFAVLGFGLLVTSFAFFVAQIDGMRCRVSVHGLKKFGITYLQITAVLLTLYLAGNSASDWWDNRH